MVKLTAFKWVPPFAQGLVRDLRARWALEEVGIPYETRLIGQQTKESAEYRKEQPFGQVPVLEDGEVQLFESGAIALYLAEKSDVLWPSSKAEQARARTWVFAALNSVEPPIAHLATIDLFCKDEEWAKLRRPAALGGIRKKFKELDQWMKGRDYLEHRFTVGDLMMTTVLRIPRHTTLLAEFTQLDAYRLRCEARPAFQRALAAQMKPFLDPANAPTRANA